MAGDEADAEEALDPKPETRKPKPETRTAAEDPISGLGQSAVGWRDNVCLQRYPSPARG